jgi:hypothetical protein
VELFLPSPYNVLLNLLVTGGLKITYRIGQKDSHLVNVKDKLEISINQLHDLRRRT